MANAPRISYLRGMRSTLIRDRVSFLTVSLSLLTIPCVRAADEAGLRPPPWHPTGFGGAVLSSVVFGLTGIVLAVVGFKLFDLVTPFNLEKEMCENKNVAVGILCGAIVLGLCHIIAASMS